MRQEELFGKTANSINAICSFSFDFLVQTILWSESELQ
jgi:hypothetical protein